MKWDRQGTLLSSCGANLPKGVRLPACYNPNMALDPTVALTPRGSDAEGPDSNLKSAGLMLFAVLCYSFIPVAIVLTESKDHPFLFTMGWRGGIAIVYALFLAARFSRLFFNWTVWKLIFRRMFSFQILLVAISYFNIALFAMSLRYLDVAVAVILFEIAPIVAILAAWLSHHDLEGNQTSVKMTPAKLLFIALGVVGTAFVLSGQLVAGVREAASSSAGPTAWVRQLADTMQGTASSSADPTLWLLALGVLLAVGSAIIYGLNRRSLAWGAGLKGALPDDLIEQSGYESRSIDLFCATVAGLIATLLIVPLSLLIGINSGETILGKSVSINEIIPASALVLIVIGGALIQPIAGVAWRQSSIMLAHNPGINALEHMRPILTLVWLLALSLTVVNGERLIDEISVAGDYLIIGIVAIIIANLLLIFEAEIRWGFKALMIALGACGTFVYFRSSLFKGFLSNGDNSWVTDHYFEVVGLSATIFTLLLAFRIATLVSRSHAEEAQAFRLFRKLDMFTKRGVIDRAVLECVIRIDAPRNQADLKEAYSEARGYFNSAVFLNNVDERLSFNEAEAELDAMARSKQLGLVLGELFALIIFAGITIFFALLSRPEFDAEQQPFSMFLIDVFAMLISAVIIFLTINVWDLHHERGMRQLEMQPQQDDQDSQAPYVVVFPETRHQLSDRWLSIIVGIGIVIIYAGLLSHRHLGWFVFG